MDGHFFVINGDITRLKCDAWLLPSDQKWLVTDSFAAAVGNPEGKNPYHLRPASGWPESGVIAHRVSSGPEPDIWLGDVGRSVKHPIEHYVERARAFAKASIEAIYVNRKDELQKLGRLPLIAFNVLGSGDGGKRSQRGELLNALIPAMIDIAEGGDESIPGGADVVLVCHGPVMYSAAQATRRKKVEERRRTGEVDEASRLPSPGESLETKAQFLADRLREGRLVLFLGAGVSVDSGIPDWQNLITDIAEDSGVLTPEEIELLTKFDFRDQGTILNKKLSDVSINLGEKVRERLLVTQYGLTHGLLASLPFSEAVTTNFDQVFEAACQGAGKVLAVLPGGSVVTGQPWLLKLHGDAQSSIVFTRAEYLSAMATQSALRGIVQAMLITKHMMFVGYSLRDDDFHQLVHEVRYARNTNDAEFGTALMLESNELTGSVWNDIAFVSMGLKTSNDRPIDPADVYRAARRLWIMLDLIGQHASSDLAYLADDTFGDLQGDEEARLSRIITDLIDFISETKGQWAEVEKFLGKFKRHDDR